MIEHTQKTIILKVFTNWYEEEKLYLVMNEEDMNWIDSQLDLPGNFKIIPLINGKIFEYENAFKIKELKMFVLQFRKLCGTDFEPHFCLVNNCLRTKKINNENKWKAD